MEMWKEREYNTVPNPSTFCYLWGIMNACGKNGWLILRTTSILFPFELGIYGRIQKNVEEKGIGI